jgi:hypothetical protein
MQIRHSFFCFLLLLSLSVSQTSAAEEVPASPTAATATMIGTVLDPNDGTVPGATVIAQRGSVTEQKVIADDNGFFRLEHLTPGVKYRVIIGAQGFVTWESPEVTLKPGQSMEVSDIHLTIKTVESSVTVSLTTEEIATEQLKIEEQQRVLGFIPNFYVVYDKHPAPLTTKLKYKLAIRTMTDPVTFLGSAFIAGLDQAADTPDYQQGVKGYFERFGANYANGLTDIMFGGAVLPSLFHQDPRYYYMGTGPVKTRLKHALLNPIICKGDNGNTQFNYSGLGGYLISGALANTYYPASNRGVGLTFSTFGIDVAADMAGGVIQEFVLKKLTPSAKKNHPQP